MLKIQGMRVKHEVMRFKNEAQNHQISFLDQPNNFTFFALLKKQTHNDGKMKPKLSLVKSNQIFTNELRMLVNKRKTFMCILTIEERKSYGLFKLLLRTKK